MLSKNTDATDLKISTPKIVREILGDAWRRRYGTAGLYWKKLMLVIP